MTELATANPPSSFIVRWVRRLRPDFATPGLALDIAAGRGRHTRVLAKAGFHAVGIERDLRALEEARRAAPDGLRYSLVAADLTTIVLPPDRFQVVVVSRYLDRALFGAILTCLAPGGSLVYETFTTRQLQLGRGPRSPAHLLNPGELRTLVSPASGLGSGSDRVGFTVDILFDEEVVGPSAVARLVARKRTREITHRRTAAGGPADPFSLSGDARPGVRSDVAEG